MILLLVALSLAPLVYAVKGANVATVVVNGKVVVRNRRMETVDEGEVLAKARELSGLILQSLERR